MDCEIWRVASRDRLFVSYAHQDKDLVRVFLQMLRRLQPPGERIWWDGEILAGEQWRQEIQDQLDRAHSSLLFISNDFLESTFINEIELPNLRNAGVRLLLIPARKTTLEEDASLGELQWLAEPTAPLLHPHAGVQDERITAAAERAQSALRQHGFPDEARDAMPAAPRRDDRPRRPAAPLPPPAPAGPRLGVPELPPEYVPRPGEHADIAAALLSPEGGALGLTGRGLGIHGQGGIGKSVIAAALARDDHLAGHFPDGVAWQSVGEFPDLVGLQRDLATRLGVEVGEIRAPAEGRQALAAALADKRLLLVVDDVWSAMAVEAFRVVGPRGRLLYTTRDPELVAGQGIASVAIDVLHAAAATAVLAGAAGAEVDELPATAEQVVEFSDGVALAVALVGAAAGRSGLGWEGALVELKEGRRVFADHPYAPVFAAMRAGFAALSEREAEALTALAVFPEEVVVPRRAIERLWAHRRFGLAPEQAGFLLRLLAQRNMVLMDKAHKTVRLHDLLREFLRFRTRDLAAAHRTLVEAYAALRGAGATTWSGLPSGEPYIWDHLIGHLIGAGELDKARGAVCDLAFLGRRIEETGTFGAEADLSAVGDALPDDALVGRLAICLRQWASAIAAQRGTVGLVSTVHARLAISGADSAGLAQLAGGPWIRHRWGLSEEAGGLLRVLEGHQGPVGAVAFSPDGARLASGSGDGSVRLWDAESGALLGRLEGHESPVGAVAFSPDGARLASGSGDGSVRFWDAESGALLGRLEGHESPVGAVAFSPDGARLASGSDDGSMRLWDAQSGGQLLRLARGRLLHRFRQRLALLGHGRSVSAVAFSPDGARLASGSGDGSVRLWDAESGALLARLEGHESPVGAVAFSPDGARLASGWWDGSVRLWDTESGAQLVRLEGHESRLLAVAFSPDGARLASGSDDGSVRLWDAQSGAELLRLVGHEGSVRAVAFSPDGAHLASGSWDRSVRLWHAEAAAQLAPLEGHESRVLAVAFSPDGARLVSGSWDGSVRLFDAEAGAQLARLEGHESGGGAVAFSPDGARLALGLWDGSVRLFDAETGAQLARLKGPGARVAAVAFSPDGARLALGLWDGSVRLLDTEAEVQLARLKAHGRPVVAVAFSPDGASLASGSDDGSVRLWDAQSGAELLRLVGNEGSVRAVAFSPDGARLASGSGDRSVRLWDAETGEQLGRLEGHEGRVLAVAFSPDGARLASGSDDRSLRLWDAEAGVEMARVALATAPSGIVWSGGRLGVAAGRDVLVFEVVD
jgi:WD40 repeat protein